ncbi:Glyoxalase/bleomycin resistance protein/dioxygenase [Croceitalea dokdonensis DOKDO 023]|uniref:Glyoxalase/bleomycin resistance protein/dioxygenase n=1 Tax=Croceitalea dokdonensis DOKDO 023 TaxID=1300341 RepID=A0A0P7ASX7_9FLAO|nr:Glyoxalase/bleomycin resistance protein/dioxygenase [Croceitalea dokdonensis DOKDO 023]
MIHYKPQTGEALHTNAVDGKNVPVPHYGVVLPWDTFQTFSKELKSKGVEFVIEPYVRFKGEVGEQATMFFLDPAGNALEFKAFKDMDQLFAK